MTMTRRLQILIDPERHQRLERAAAASGSSVAAVIRDAIDRMLPHDGIDRITAARTLLDAPTMPVDNWATMKPSMIDEMAARAIDEA